MGKINNQARPTFHRPVSLVGSLLACGFSLSILGMGGIDRLAAAALALPLRDERLSPVSNFERSQPRLLAQRNREMRVKFAPGQSSATVKNSVLRGTRDVYILEAGRQQVMTIKLTSMENSAVFDVIAPPDGAMNRRIMREGAREWTVRLPQSGEYQIVVGPTRGNASYRLVVSVK
jgi:hypothetical protein